MLFLRKEIPGDSNRYKEWFYDHAEWMRWSYRYYDCKPQHEFYARFPQGNYCIEDYDAVSEDDIERYEIVLDDVHLGWICKYQRGIDFEIDGNDYVIDIIIPDAYSNITPERAVELSNAIENAIEQYIHNNTCGRAKYYYLIIHRQDEIMLEVAENLRFRDCTPEQRARFQMSQSVRFSPKIIHSNVHELISSASVRSSIADSFQGDPPNGEGEDPPGNDGISRATRKRSDWPSKE